MAPSPSVPVSRAMALLRAIAAGADSHELRAISGSRPTLARDLHSIRRDLKVDVRWDHWEHRYQIHDWGAVNPRRI